MRCSHSFHTFSSQKQGAYEHAAATGSRPTGDADDDISDEDDDDAIGADDDAAALPLAADDAAAADDAGRTGDLLPLPALGLLQSSSIHGRLLIWQEPFSERGILDIKDPKQTASVA